MNRNVATDVENISYCLEHFQ